ncbi:MAG TPA: glucose dehydrogenase [Desulfotomaculum sp.]|nr:glucose dehydrogenase [Desulfotomaculum sp.]
MNERYYDPCYYSGRVPVRPGDFYLQSGYRLEPVITGLTYPTSVTFDNAGNIYVGEAGYSYGPAKADGQGRILAVGPGGRAKEVARGFRGPMTSVKWHKGNFYVAEGAFPGRIYRVARDGRRVILVSGLRSGGDHFTTEIVFGPDEVMYFGVGTFTNSAVVGIDNFFYGWLAELPNQHDVPCRDIVLTGINFASIDPFALAEGEVRIVKTGAFKPFGTTSYPGEVVNGELYCNGVIYRCAPDGSGLAPFADGFRNPFGLGFSPTGRFYAIDQGYDDRGSRPVTNSLDPMWEVIPGGWYGWPDFVGGEPITNPEFSPQGKPPHQFVLKYHPPLAGRPVLQFAHHSATMKFDFSTNPYFGYPNQAFAAQFGSAAPITGHPHGMPGFRVVRVDPQAGQVHDFLVSNNPGPDGTGPARPVDVKFDPRGENLYIVDFGVMQANQGAIIPWSRTGSLWKVSRI